MVPVSVKGLCLGGEDIFDVDVLKDGGDVLQGKDADWRHLMDECKEGKRGCERESERSFDCA